MRFLRSVIALLAIIINCIPGCVEPYTPDEGETESGALAIYAHLTDAPEDQVIYISRSSNFLKPASSPEEYCFAYIERDDGWIAYFAETEPGYYVLEADSGYLSPGLEYRLNVETPSGDTYQSSFEKMHASMEIDSVYFNLETILGENDNVRSDGIRFFVDFNINKEAGTYLLWRLTETYEFHNPNYRGFVYGKDRRMRELLPEESWRTCWISSVLPDFYTLSATPFSNGLYRAKDLNFVSNQPQYLFHIYSLLVHQYTLSEGAYVYWRKLKDNSTALGGLFSRQPEIINSNIRNTNNDSEKVIGYFSVSGVSEKRIFVKNVENLELDENDWYCFPSMNEMPPLAYIPRSALPRYFSEAWYDGVNYFGETELDCLDCRELKNSTHIKPGFWPE